MVRLNVLDLCCGLGGWSKPWKDNGHLYVGVDIVYPADVIADVRRLPFGKFPWDVILASPPCTEFSLRSMPWYDISTEPDMSIVNACFDYAYLCNPLIFVLENVCGLQKYIGQSQDKIGSRYLWGWFPEIKIAPGDDLFSKWKMAPSLDRARLRAKIPGRLAESLYQSVMEKFMPPPAPAAKPTEIVKTTRKPRARAPENESKADKFKRLANHRVPRLIKLLNSVASLANKSQYEWTPEQINLIATSLESALRRLKDRFAGSKQDDSGFKL